MLQNDALKTFLAALRSAGAESVVCADWTAVALTIRERARGGVFVPEFPSGRRGDLVHRLREAGCSLVDGTDRAAAAAAAAGVTGANFAVAETGTVVLESTAEEVRLASSLPVCHFVLLDPRKIVPDGAAAIPWMRRMQRERAGTFLAWITGPSRTADIERVLTIGVHGPKELYVLLLEGLSDDFLEM